jgi:tetratricopeptide (TPR) repeat protein
MIVRFGHVLSVLIFSGLLLNALPRSASAQQIDSESVRVNAAKKACALGDYEKGAEILADLFVATDNIVHVYNQGRCYQQNNRWERALARFREFLRKAKNLTKAQRAEVEQNIAECEEALRKAPPPAAPLSASPAPAGPESPTPVAMPLPKAEVRPAHAAPPQETPPPHTSAINDSGRGLRIAGLVLAGVGVAAIGAGVFCTFKTRNISSNERKYGATPEQEDERKRYETWGWVSYGVGATALATGVVLYLLGWPTSESGQMALLPRMNSTGGDLLLTGRF